MDFKVTPEYVANAAANCDATANEIQAQLAALKSYVVNLEATYHGVAATTFQALMQDYDTFGRMLNNALTDIGSGLRGNYVNYTDTEQQNISNLVPIQGDLPGARL
ncbi:WXG100 family type VII secretion target [Dactylosporangium salmoneum]|uniref:ESAT-6-like protein n=1 Tax=Dactylosporangium salmoneum TaxID=53361 RepID=A0ABP5UBN2_9ACTN